MCQLDMALTLYYLLVKGKSLLALTWHVFVQDAVPIRHHAEHAEGSHNSRHTWDTDDRHCLCPPGQDIHVS